MVATLILNNLSPMLVPKINIHFWVPLQCTWARAQRVSSYKISVKAKNSDFVIPSVRLDRSCFRQYILATYIGEFEK